MGIFSPNEKIELVRISELTPSDYNPRVTDPQRLELLQTSLLKLGFVMPIYAVKATGVLLSGHQRLLAAKNIGAERVPVVYVDIDDSDTEMNRNIVFNRLTNDMLPDETSEILLQRLKDSIGDFQTLLGEVKDKDPLSDDFFPCVNSVSRIDTSTFDVDNLSRIYNRESVSICRQALELGVVMPVVVSESGKVVNGSYRYYSALEVSKLRPNHYAEYFKTYPSVVISDKEAELAALFTNMISMSFDLKTSYGDRLRTFAFRRQTNKVDNLTKALRFWGDNKREVSTKESLKNPQLFWSRFRTEHGEKLLDFGAGQRRNELVLKRKGFDVCSFEPLPTPIKEHEPELHRNPDIKNDRPNIVVARKVTQNLIDWLSDSNTSISSIFMNSVLNSVPFYEDRVKALCVVHGMCGFDTSLYGSVPTPLTYFGNTKSFSSVSVKSNQQGDLVISHNEKAKSVIMNTEPNAVVSDLRNFPKVQKYHTKEELRKLLSIFWDDVIIYGTDRAALLFFKASNPKRVNLSLLKKCVDFEFSIPVDSKGTTTGMQDEVYQAILKHRGLSHD